MARVIKRVAVPLLGWGQSVDGQNLLRSSIKE
jgi:hypothetical protein